MSNALLSALGRILGDAVRAWSRDQKRASSRVAPTPSRTGTPHTDAYPGDFSGMPTVSYTPVPGKTADPGEVVWTWVPYEEDHSQGKDRPVLVIGRDGGWLLCLQLTSQDHDLDARQEAANGHSGVVHWFACRDPGRSANVRFNGKRLEGTCR